MAQAKIELTLGHLKFAGEAEAVWLEKQLDKILQHVKSTDPEDVANNVVSDKKDTQHQTMKETLSAYLKSCSATSSQVKKFLATACWLTAKGTKNLGTNDVTKALSDNHQGKLGNPADCLNKNVGKGLCEKQGKQFYVTEDGFTSLGKAIE